MATTTVLGTTVRNNTGKVLHSGNIGGSRFRGISIVTNTLHQNRYSGTYALNHIFSGYMGTAVAITTITQSSSTGKCLITKSSHGLSVGDMLMVYAADVGAYNCTHVVTSVVSANTVQTNVSYVSDTVSAHGSYKPVARNFNKMVARTYIGKIIQSTVAGTTSSVMRIPAGDFHATSIPMSVGQRRYNITSWSYLTGAATKGANAGVADKFHDIAANNDNLANEAFPSRAVPGELVYRSGKALPVQDDYSPRTS
jgi:hypothetical protein